MTMSARERLIFPLDVPDRVTARGFVEKLREEVGLFKVGLELFLAAGAGVLQDLAELAGLNRVFLDLKLYDIPATVLGAMRTFAPGIALITVPSDLGPTGLKKIAAAAPGAHKILAVTLLTSTPPADLRSLGYDSRYWAVPTELVVLRARMAQAAGCHGVVCSGREAGTVRQACGPDFLIVCPGIRPVWAAVPGDDQSRIVTPLEAIRNGADYLVVGRPLRQAPDPAAAARRVVAEMAEALGK
jgi:orotidine-5'-phosphate decarboxylase